MLEQMSARDSLHASLESVANALQLLIAEQVSLSGPGHDLGIWIKELERRVSIIEAKEIRNESA